MTKVYFIRHAQAVANITGYCYGITECDVTEEGMIQLKKLSERFKNIPIDVIYTSPLKRTYATAKAVNKYHNVSIIQEKGIVEIDAGSWEKKKWDDLRHEYPEEFEIWVNKPHLWKTTSGECMSDVFDRMVKTVNKIVRDNVNKTIVIVSHACALRNYFCHARGLLHENMCDLNYVRNTAVGYVEYDSNFNSHVIFDDDISHLL